MLPPSLQRSVPPVGHPAGRDRSTVKRAGMVSGVLLRHRNRQTFVQRVHRYRYPFRFRNGRRGIGPIGHRNGYKHLGADRTSGRLRQAATAGSSRPCAAAARKSGAAGAAGVAATPPAAQGGCRVRRPSQSSKHVAVERPGSARAGAAEGDAVTAKAPIAAVEGAHAGQRAIESATVEQAVSQ